MIYVAMPSRQIGKSRAHVAARALDQSPMTPARYLQLRREAAGLSILQIAEHLASKPGDVSLALSVIRSLEQPGIRARHRSTLDSLRRAFPFDIDVYRQLCEEPAERHPQICRGCGCSTYDACVEADGYTCCLWAVPTLCTRCMDGHR